MIAIKSKFIIICVFLFCIYLFHVYTVNHNQKYLPIVNKGIDSLRLICIMYACDCPNWVDYNKYMKNEEDINLNKEQFNTTFDDSYYIEREDLGLGNCLVEQNGMVVDFFGKLDTFKRLSKENIYMDPNPIKGKVVIYTDYKIIDKGFPKTYYPPEYTDSTDLGRPENQ